MWLNVAGVFTGLAIATFVILEIARHLQWRKHRNSGFVPGTQHWCFIATCVAGVFEILAIISFIVWGVQRS